MGKTKNKNLLTRRRGGRGERQKLKQLWEKQKQEPSHAETRRTRRKAKAKAVKEASVSRSFLYRESQNRKPYFFGLTPKAFKLFCLPLKASKPLILVFSAFSAPPRDTVFTVPP